MCACARQRECVSVQCSERRTVCVHERESERERERELTAAEIVFSVIMKVHW